MQRADNLYAVIEWLWPLCIPTPRDSSEHSAKYMAEFRSRQTTLSILKIAFPNDEGIRV